MVTRGNDAETCGFIPTGHVLETAVCAPLCSDFLNDARVRLIGRCSPQEYDGEPQLPLQHVLLGNDRLLGRTCGAPLTTRTPA